MNHLSFRKLNKIQENRKFKDENDFNRCQSNPTPNGDGLYFSHVKKAIRDADWTYRFLHMWNINIEFYLIRLSHKILSIYVINTTYMLGKNAEWNLQIVWQYEIISLHFTRYKLFQFQWSVICIKKTMCSTIRELEVSR